MLTKGPITRWARARASREKEPGVPRLPVHRPRLTKRQVYFSLGVLLVLIFSKHVYTASLVNYYTFYLIEKFGLSTSQSQVFLFAYLFSTALGRCSGDRPATVSAGSSSSARRSWGQRLSPC